MTDIDKGKAGEWDAVAVSDGFGGQTIQIRQAGNPVAITQDPRFAMLVVDLLESHKNPHFQKALAAIQSEMGPADYVPDSDVQPYEIADYERERQKRLDSLNEEE